MLMSDELKTEGLRRVNLRMSYELYEHYKSEADAMGVPVSNLIVMALSEFKKQRESLNTMSQLAQLIQIQQLQQMEQIVEIEDEKRG
jgi:hypothetical protein